MKKGKQKGVMGEAGERNEPPLGTLQEAYTCILVSLEFAKRTPASVPEWQGEIAALFGVSSIKSCCLTPWKNEFNPVVTGNVPKMYIISWMGAHQFHRT